MQLVAKETELKNLALTLWTEAATKHVGSEPVRCPACWQSHMAKKLWQHVTKLMAPVDYRKTHMAALEVAKWDGKISDVLAA